MESPSSLENFILDILPLLKSYRLVLVLFYVEAFIQLILKGTGTERKAHSASPSSTLPVSLW